MESASLNPAALDERFSGAQKPLKELLKMSRAQLAIEFETAIEKAKAAARNENPAAAKSLIGYCNQILFLKLSGDPNALLK